MLEGDTTMSDDESTEKLKPNVSHIAKSLLDLETTHFAEGTDDSTKQWYNMHLRRATLSLRDLLEWCHASQLKTEPKGDYLDTLTMFCGLEQDPQDTDQWHDDHLACGNNLFLHLDQNKLVKEALEAGEWPPPLGQEELRTFVHDFVGDKIFTDGHVPPEGSIEQVFMVLGLGALASRSLREIGNIGVLYERIDKAGPLSVNGLPSFLSVKFMNKADWERCKAAIRKHAEVIGKIEV